MGRSMHTSMLALVDGLVVASISASVDGLINVSVDASVVLFDSNAFADGLFDGCSTVVRQIVLFVDRSIGCRFIG